jgi:hypothetical protein
MDTRSVTIEQLVREGIARLRLKLLDLTNRKRPVKAMMRTSWSFPYHTKCNCVRLEGLTSPIWPKRHDRGVLARA